MPAQPTMRRHLVAQIRRRMKAAIAPIVAVRGPRQSGKTTAQAQIVEELLDQGVPPTSILWVQFDTLLSLRGVEEPILAIAEWFERHIVEAPFNVLARAGPKAYLFFDEVQNFDGWDAQLKFLVDTTAAFGLLITQDDSAFVDDPRIVSMSLSTFMLLR